MERRAAACCDRYNAGVAALTEDCRSADCHDWRAGSESVSSSQTRLSDDASPMMATLYLNDEACNRQTAPVITCDIAWVVQMQGSQPEVRLSF